MTVTVDLTAPDQDDVTPDALDAAAAIITALDEIDRRARISMLGEVDNRASECDRVHPDAVTDRYGSDIDRDPRRCLWRCGGRYRARSLELTSMTILADEHGGDDPFAVLEYALDPD